MKIEKLTFKYLKEVMNSADSGTEWDIYNCIKNVSEKINELIDAFNSHEEEKKSKIRDKNLEYFFDKYPQCFLPFTDEQLKALQEFLPSQKKEEKQPESFRDPAHPLFQQKFHEWLHQEEKQTKLLPCPLQNIIKMLTCPFQNTRDENEKNNNKNGRNCDS